MASPRTPAAGGGGGGGAYSPATMARAVHVAPPAMPGLPPPSPAPLVGVTSAATGPSSASPTAAAAATVPLHSVVISVAHSGREFDVDCLPGETLSSLRHKLEEVTGVRAKDQRLLRGADAAEMKDITAAAAAPPLPHTPTTITALAAASIAAAAAPAAPSSSSPPSPACVVFLFHHSYASSSGAALLPPLPGPVDPWVPPAVMPTAAELAASMQPPGPALQQLPVVWYQRQFAERALQGAAYANAVAAGVVESRRQCNRLKHMLSALDIAAYSLRAHYRRLHLGVERVRQSRAHQPAELQSLHEQWDKHVQALQGVEVASPAMRKILHLPEPAGAAAVAATPSSAAAAGSSSSAAASPAATSSSSSSSSFSSSSAAPSPSSSSSPTLLTLLSPSLPSYRHELVSLRSMSDLLEGDVASFHAQVANLTDNVAAIVGQDKSALIAYASSSSSSSSSVVPRADPTTGVLPPLNTAAHRSAAVMGALNKLEDLLRPASDAAGGTSSSSSSPSAINAGGLCDEATLSSLVDQLRRNHAHVESLLSSLQEKLNQDPSASISGLGSRHEDVVRLSALDEASKAPLSNDPKQQPGPLALLEHAHATLLRAGQEAYTYVAQAFVSQMSSIHSASKVLQRLEQTVTSLSSRVERLEWSLRSVQAVARLPRSYAALQDEVRRRKAFRRAYELELRAMAQRLASLDTVERGKRDQFHRDFGAYLPPGGYITIQDSADGSQAQAASAASGSSSARRKWDVRFGDLLRLLEQRPPSVREFNFSFTDFDNRLPELDGASLPSSSSSSSLSAAAAAAPSSATSSPVLAPVAGSSSPSAALRSLAAAGDDSGNPFASSSALSAEFPWMVRLEESEREVRALRAALVAKGLAAGLGPVKLDSRRVSLPPADSGSPSAAAAAAALAAAAAASPSSSTAAANASTASSSSSTSSSTMPSSPASSSTSSRSLVPSGSEVELSRRVKRCEAEKLELAARLREAEKQLRDSQENCAMHESKLEAAVVREHQLTDSLQLATVRIESLQEQSARELADTRASASSAASELRKEHARLLAVQQEKHDKFSESAAKNYFVAQQELVGLKQVHEQLKLQLVAKDKEVADAQAQLADVRTELASARERVAARDQSLESLGASLAAAQLELREDRLQHLAAREAVEDIKAGAINVAHFQADDMVLFVRKEVPRAPPADGADGAAAAAGSSSAAAVQYTTPEVWGLSRPNLFLSEDCLGLWQRNRQMADDAAFAAGLAGGVQRRAAKKAVEAAAARAQAREVLAPEVGAVAAAPADSDAAPAAAAGGASASAAAAAPPAASAAAAAAPAAAVVAAAASSPRTVCLFVTRLLCVSPQAQTVSTAAQSAQYGLPLGAEYHTVDVDFGSFREVNDIVAEANPVKVQEP